MWKHNSQMHRNVHDEINGTNPTQWVGEWKNSAAQERSCLWELANNG
jgi:hypothetical protein